MRSQVTVGRTVASSRGFELPRSTPSTARRDLLWSAAALVVGALSSLILTAVAARVLTKAEFALLGWILTAASMLALVAGPGVGVAIMSLGGRSGGAAANVARRVAVVAACGLGLVTLAWWAGLGARSLPIGDVPTDHAVAVVAVLAPGAVLGQLLDALGRLSRRFEVGVVTGDGVRRLVVAGSLLLVGSGGWRARQMYVVAAIEMVVLLVVALWLARCRRRVTSIEAPGQLIGYSVVVRQFARYAPAAAVAAAVPQGALWLAPRFTEAAEVADFGAALRVSFVLLIPSLIVMRVIQPRMAAAADIRELEPQLRAASLLTGSFSIVGLIAAVLIGPEMLTVLLGSEYRSAHVPLMLLCQAQLLASITGMCGQALIFGGAANVVAKVSMGCVVAFFAGLPGLAHRFGADGIAGLTVAVVGGLNLSLWWIARRRLRVNTAPRLDRSTFDLMRGVMAGAR